MTDAEIVELYWSRDEQAVSETETKYGNYLRTIAKNVLVSPEDCEECVNDTYLAGWNSMPTHRPSILSTYLGKLTRRISIDRFRKNHSKKHGGSEYELSLSEMGEAFPDYRTPEQELDEKLLGELINEFLHSIPEGQRNLFLGRYYFFDSVPEIAAYCKQSEGSVRVSLHRIREKLREYLTKEGYVV